jgi:hypothetical protein
MSTIIKIPPSKIFEINHSVVPLNAYENVAVETNNYDIGTGEITPSMTFVFNDFSTSGGLESRGEEQDNGLWLYNGVEFEEYISGALRNLFASVKFTLSQKTKFDLAYAEEGDLPRITSHKLLRVTTYYATTGEMAGKPYTVRTLNDIGAVIISGNDVTINYFVDESNTNGDYGGRRLVLNETISLYGDYFIEGAKVNQSYSLGATKPKNILKLPTNELVQTKNLYGRSSTPTIYSEKLLKEVYERYKGGKETATLLCGVDKYYDLESQTIIIDPEAESEEIPPLFKKYDIVVPFIKSNNGEIPLSKNADGSAKTFQVLGVNIKYNGVLKQEIVIQEYAT